MLKTIPGGCNLFELGIIKDSRPDFSLYNAVWDFVPKQDFTFFQRFLNDGA